jgi:hypothetical protein
LLEEVLPNLAELLDRGAEVFDLVAAAGYVLAHFVDDEDQGLALPPPSPKLEGALDDLADGDRSIAVPLGMRPRVRRIVGFAIKLVEYGAGTRELLSALANDGPLNAVEFFAGLDELAEFALGFELDLQFCDVEVLGVVELSQQDGVHQLGNALRHLTGIALFGDLEENDFGGSLSVDEVEQVADTLVLDLLLEKIGEVLAQECLVLKREAEVLGEGAFPRPEEARYPDADTFIRIGRGVGIAWNSRWYCSRMLSVATYSVISSWTDCSSA